MAFNFGAFQKPMDFGQYGLDLNQLFGQQQGYIQGLGNPSVNNMSNIMNMLTGFQGQQQANPFVNKLGNFQHGVSDDVRGTMMGIASNPFSGTAGGTLEQMLSTGMPTDVSGIGEASHMRSNQAMEEMFGAIQERAAMQGGLAGSGVTAQMSNAAGGLANESFAKMLEAGVGAEESARGRQMGALGQFLAGQGLAGQMAGSVGGLEQGAAGLNLQALLGGGNLAAQTDDQTLRALMSAGGLATNMDQLGFAGLQSQAGAGQDFLNMLPGYANSGMFGGGRLNPHEVASYILAAGGAQNQMDFQRAGGMQNIANNQYANANPYNANPINALMSALSGGTEGGMDPGLAKMHGIQNEMANVSGFGPHGGVNPMKVGGLKKERFIAQHEAGGAPAGTGATSLSTPEQFRAKADVQSQQRTAQREAVGAGGSPYGGGTPPALTPWGQQIPQGVINWGG